MNNRVENLLAPGTSTILEGKAPNPINLSEVCIEGNIDAPSVFYLAHKDKDAYDFAKAIVEYSVENRSIRFRSDPHHPLMISVKGKVSLSAVLEKFHINESKMWSRKELLDHVRFHRRFFQAEQVDQLIMALHSVKGMTSTDFEGASDHRGNAKALVDRKVHTNLPESFVVHLPLFGHSSLPSRFKVNLNIEPISNGVQFWLDSPELEELIQTQSEAIVMAEVAKFDPVPCLSV